MRIGIDAAPAVQTRGGVGTHTRCLLKALVAQGEEHQFLAYVPRERAFDQILNECSVGEQLKWVEVDRVPGRDRGKTDGLDLYHGTNFKAHTSGRFGAVLTIHDLWLDRHPEYSKKLFGQRLSFIRTRRSALKASRVIAVSQFTADEIHALYGIPPDRISVVHNGVSPEFFPQHDGVKFSQLRERVGMSREPFLLFLGGAEPRKNHDTLFRAYAQTPELFKHYILVVVGNPVNRFGSVMETAQGLGIADRVVLPGAVSTEELLILYSHAQLFVFPSLYEGFGLPVLEAMACGAPVVASQGSAIQEVAGEAAVLVPHKDPDALGQAMVGLLNNTEYREEMIRRGFDRVTQFTWEEAARRTLDVYREVCGEK